MELLIQVSENDSIPLHRQVYEQLRAAILEGRLKSGERLPSTRALADSLDLSRTTVALSYDQLASEGYIRSSAGSGTYVNDQLPNDLFEVRTSRSLTNGTVLLTKLSTYAARIPKRNPSAKRKPGDWIEFKQGRPALTQLSSSLKKILFDALPSEDTSLLDYADDSAGYMPLREALAAYLTRARAVTCTANNVLITSGTQQSLELCSRLLVEPGQHVGIEDPGYLSARMAFRTNGAQLVPLPVDEEGLITDSLVGQVSKDIKLVYVTPSHQFPTGGVMSLPRRLKLLAWARANDVVVFEDDYDSEFRYSGPPSPSLQGLDTAGLVIYGGTFAKVLFPSLRLGYLVLPAELMPVFSSAKWLLDRQCDLVHQRALAEIIAGGMFEQHIRRMRTHYDRLRLRLVRQLSRRLGKRVTVLGDSAGVHLMIRLKTKHTADELWQRMLNQCVSVTDARAYYLNELTQGEFVELILGYGNLSEAEIDEGVRRLAEAAL